MTEQVDFADRADVKELAERIKLLIPGIQALDSYLEAGSLALAQASLTSGLNPFLGEIWVLRRGRSAEPCTGFSIKPGIKGARRAAKNQAAKWGFIPPYYRPLFREPSDFEVKLMSAKASDAAVACDLELLLPADHPWYKDAGGQRFTVTGLGIQKQGSNSQMAPFQAARKRAEEDALKLAFDLPIYDAEEDMGAPTIQDLTKAQVPSQPASPAAGNTQDPITPVPGLGLAGKIGPMPDFSRCGPNYWNNMVEDLEKNGLIPSRAWLVARFRQMGVTEVTENNAQELVNQALEEYPVGLPAEKEEAPADPTPEAPRETVAAAGRQVDAGTGEIVEKTPRPLSAAGVVALVHEKLDVTKEKYGQTANPTPEMLGIYRTVIGKLSKDPGEEQDLLFYLLFSQKVDHLSRAELAAFFGWCLDPKKVKASGAWVLNEWAVAEARGIHDFNAEQKEAGRKAKEAAEKHRKVQEAHQENLKAEGTTLPLPESMQPSDPDAIDPEELPFTDPPEEEEHDTETE